MTDHALLAVDGLTKRFFRRRRVSGPKKEPMTALDRVSFALYPGESLALVGESGCGKSTLAKSILRLQDVDAGAIRLDGVDITRLSRRQMQPFRRRMQMIFQDPVASLNPRMRVAQIVSEPLKAAGVKDRRQRWRQAAAALEQVGLRSDDMRRFPHAFSGGQRQRIGIARALCVKPALVVADEPLSALDVSIQAQVLRLLADLKARLDLAYLFITHDLKVAVQLCERMAVMYLGRFMELAPRDRFVTRPLHPYTQMLVASILHAHPRVRQSAPPSAGPLPDPYHPPGGCVFHPRCIHAMPRCRALMPELVAVKPGHQVACWLHSGKDRQ